MKLNEIKNDIAAICKQYNIKNYIVQPDGAIDVTGDVNLSGKKFSILPLKFGKVTGNFSCSSCPNLTSLEGAPVKIGGNFSCSSCHNLTSLEGAPVKIGGNFSCSSCHNLISLKGAPSEVGSDFSCSVCPNLTSLVGAPSKVGSNFYCGSCLNLTSLVGAPNEVVGDFYCSACPNLVSLEGAPSKIGDNLICHNCPNLTKLSHLGSINRNLYINDTAITNLLAVFDIENLKEIAYGNDKITNIINKHLKNPDRDGGMIECRQELKDAGFGEYVRLK